MTNKPKKLILLDGNAIIHRAYHALPPLTTKSGELVNAVYGFSSTVLSVIEKFEPDYIAASFDLPAPTFRHEKYAAYKANRTKADDDLYAQIPRVKEVVKAFNIPIYEQAGFEADDVIGTIAKKMSSDGQIETIIVTGDMDTLQLVNDHTKVYAMRRGLTDSVLFDEARVFEKYTLTPKQLIDYKGLRGDPSDNIPGVKGIGEKTAISLLKDYHSVEGVYQNIENIKGAVKDKLEKDKANALLSKDLGEINTDAPIDFDLEKARLADFDKASISALFGELNFFSLIKRLPGSIHDAKQTPAAHGVSDFKYTIIEQSARTQFMQEALEQKEIAFDLHREDGALLGYSFSWKTGRAFFLQHSAENLSVVKEIFESPAIGKISHDIKDAYKTLRALGVRLATPFWDTMLAAYVIDPGTKVELGHLIFAYLGEEYVPESKSKKQLSFIQPLPDIKEYSQASCRRADYCFKLKAALGKKIDTLSNEQRQSGAEKTVRDVLEAIELPLVEVLAEMELAGIQINPVLFKGISEKITATIASLEKSAYKLAETEFNLNSPKQLAEILFEKLKLPTFNIKKGKTGYSTASSELEKLRSEHKIIEKIEEYRELFKLKTTYLDTIPLLADRDSRVHTTFNQAVAATGRLSSTEPNLQNIPIKTELGQLMRTAFVAKEGYSLISADYSQIDLRCVAHVSNDKKMIEAFHRGDDIHRLTAAEVNKVTPSQVTETMRRSAKELNFGIIYGMGAFGFSQSAGISREDAQQFITTYMEKFSGVANYMKSTREFAKKYGYAETLLGRRRNIAEINSPNFQVANAAERVAINMPIQGLAADIMKLAMIHVFAEFKNNLDVVMLLQVHDEIILEVKTEIAERVAERVKELMEGAYKLRVPLIADVSIGDNWGEI